MKITLDNIVNIDYEKASETIGGFLRAVLRESGAKGFAIGVSGGVDSSTTLMLAAKYVGSKKVYALVMPDRDTTPKEDIDDALEIIGLAGVEYSIVYINDIVKSYSSTLPFFNPAHNIATGNLRARIRMSILYYYANLKNYLVLGTGDRSELLIGYFTKYGDGGVDVLPLGPLYKTQVRRLGLYLGVPRRIAFKPSSPRLWPGHMAEKELGLRYEDIDRILYGLFDLGLSADDVAEATDLPIETVEKILGMHRRSRHKRALPPIPKLPWVDEAVKEI